MLGSFLSSATDRAKPPQVIQLEGGAVNIILRGVRDCSDGDDIMSDLWLNAGECGDDAHLAARKPSLPTRGLPSFLMARKTLVAGAFFRTFHA